MTKPLSTGVPRVPRPGASSYAQILKSSALIGGSSMVTVAVSVVRAKTVAMLIGPGGVGLAGLYGSILDLAQSLAGMGLSNSGVRAIAVAAGSADLQVVARTAAVLRSTSLVLGALGAASLLLLSGPLSMWTFGSGAMQGSVAVLALAVLARLVSDGQSALLQGLRRIGDLARISVLSAGVTAAATVVLVFMFREQGIVPSLLLGAGATLAASWWFRRRVALPEATVSVGQMVTEGGELLALGLAFMVSTALTAGTAYVVRVLIRDELGLPAAGLYQSAWVIGGMYVGFVLQAMGSDFYPRLASVVTDHHECNRLVNEQAQIGLLLTGPGVIATLSVAPWVVSLLYDREFMAAVEPLRWITLGMALRVIAWPMGFIVLAKGARNLFMVIEAAAAAVHLLLSWWLIPLIGLNGAAMAFVGLYVWHSIFVYITVKRLTGFAWSRANTRIAAVVMPAIVLVFVALRLLPGDIGTWLGLAAALLAAAWSWYVIFRLLPAHQTPALMRRLASRFGV